MYLHLYLCTACNSFCVVQCLYRPHVKCLYEKLQLFNFKVNSPLLADFTAKLSSSIYCNLQDSFIWLFHWYIWTCSSWQGNRSCPLPTSYYNYWHFYKVKHLKIENHSLENACWKEFKAWPEFKKTKSTDFIQWLTWWCTWSLDVTVILIEICRVETEYPTAI